MTLRNHVIMVSVFLLLVSGAAGAMDYNNWVPLFPDTIAGMEKSGDLDAMNYESGDQTWSYAHYTYGDDGSGEYIDLTVVGGQAAPQVMTFKTMPDMNMETEEQIMKTVKVSNYEALLNIEKKKKRGTLIIGLADNLIAVIEVVPTDEAEIMKVTEDVPLDKFKSASQAK
jgi:hypothetical protein